MAPIIIIFISVLESKGPRAKDEDEVCFSSNWIYHCSSRLSSSRIDELLQSDDYINVITLDFHKAFDSVRPHNLASELAIVKCLTVTSRCRLGLGIKRLTLYTKNSWVVWAKVPIRTALWRWISTDNR